MGKRVGLARAGAGDDQERTSRGTSFRLDTKLDGVFVQDSACRDMYRPYGINTGKPG